MTRKSDRLNDIIRLGTQLNIIQDEDILLQRILREARNFVNADAGSIYIRKDDFLLFKYSQNATKQKELPAGQKLPYTNLEPMKINKGSIAGYVASTGKVLNISNVYAIKKNTPYRFNPDPDLSSNYRTKSMLTVPMKDNLGEIIGVLQIINAMDNKCNIVRFNPSDKVYIQHFANTASIVLQRAQLTRTLLIRMISMAELRDPKETGQHVHRVASYSVELYEKWASLRSIPESEVDRNKDALRMAAMLHDVGKVAVSDSILKKPGKLSEEEFEIMKTHSYKGAKLLGNKQSQFDEIAAIAALRHHENWDGTGYPGHIDVNTGKPLKVDENGRPMPLKGEKIPIYGRIVALADVYDALSSKRVYKDAWDQKDVINEIKYLSGKKFDPELVEIFLDSLDLFESIRRRYPENDS